MAGNSHQNGDTTATLKGGGVVTHLEKRQHFGFIKSNQGGVSVYFHMNLLKGGKVKVGQEVYFVAQKGERGWRAVSVIL